MTSTPALSGAHIALLALVGFLAGAINAVAGGGTLISFPALLVAGYPAITANVTNTVALVPGYLGGSIAYRAELEGQQDRLRVLGAVSIIGALAGSYLLVISPAAVFRRIVPWLILFACGLLAAQPWVARLIRREENTARVEHRSLPLLVAQFLGAVYGAYFGAGLGVIALAVLGIFLTDTLQRLNALKGLLSLVINVVAAVYFALFGPVAWLPAAIMAGASLAGGHLGVGVARKLSPTVLRSAVILFGVAATVRLLV